jgi:threonine dehydrogenase-like Zn-dependent dehydrogenase
MEAHGSTTMENMMDRLLEKLMIQTERLGVVRDMIYACRKGGTMSTMGVYAGMGDRVPLGIAFNKGLKWVMGQMHGQKYIPRLFEYWELGRVDPGFIFTHEMPLAQAADGYRLFRDKRDNCVKILLRP